MATAHAASASPTHRSWRPWRAKIVWGFFGGVIALRALTMWAFRTRNPAVIGRVKAFNRRWLNPWMLGHAGGRHWYAGRLEHLGRRSGAFHATPLWVDPVRGGFILPMPYGRDVDWAKNLLAAGEAVLQDHGVRYRIGNPRIVPFAEALPELPGVTRRFASMYGIQDFMRVDALPGSTVEQSPPTCEPTEEIARQS